MADVRSAAAENSIIGIGKFVLFLKASSHAEPKKPSRRYLPKIDSAVFPFSPACGQMKGAITINPPPDSATAHNANAHFPWRVRERRNARHWVREKHFSKNTPRTLLKIDLGDTDALDSVGVEDASHVGDNLGEVSDHDVVDDPTNYPLCGV
jgi:hypothetical protein